MLEELNIYFIDECNSVDISNELKYKGYIDLSGLTNDELWTHATVSGYKEQRQIFHDCSYNRNFYDYYLSNLRKIVLSNNPYFDWVSYIKYCKVDINSEYYALSQYISTHDLSGITEYLDISYTNPHYSIIAECASFDYNTYPFAYGAGQWSSGLFGLMVPCKSTLKRGFFMYLYDILDNEADYLDEYDYNESHTKVRLDLYINGTKSDYYIEETLDPSRNMLGVLFKKKTINNAYVSVDYSEIVLEENSVISWYCSDLLAKDINGGYTNYPHNPSRNRFIMILEPYDNITNAFIEQKIKIVNLENEIIQIKEYLKL